MDSFPLGKLPHAEMRNWLSDLIGEDKRIVLGPGVGLDCAVIDFGETYLVIKTDPITFTAEDIGFYAVQINANDIATTGAQPRWFLATLLLPEGSTHDSVAEIFGQLRSACSSIDVKLIGGHTEITAGIERVIVSGTMLGEVKKDSLITPRGASPGDAILLSKGIPIEAGSILAREFSEKLDSIDEKIIDRARNYLVEPGISVIEEAKIAVQSGGVTAMHDPTEGGIFSGLWEMAEAANVGLVVEKSAIPILPEAARLCDTLGIDPLASIASGALLITVKETATAKLMQNVGRAGIAIAKIGTVTDPGEVLLMDGGQIQPLPRPARDAIAELFERDRLETKKSDNEGP
jgi:hydrogenase maturation factor